MYSVIRWYQGDPTVLAELARRMGESAHEVMATIPGWLARACYLRTRTSRRRTVNGQNTEIALIHALPKGAGLPIPVQLR